MVDLLKADGFGTLGFVDGAMGHAEAVRRLLWLAVSGESGVPTVTSMQVLATNPPGPTVTINAGSAVLQGVPLGAPVGQSYMAMAPAPKNVPIPANTGSTIRAWDLYVTGRDPQYPIGQGEVDPTLATSYTSATLIAAGTGVSFNGPYLRLATITLPPNTATVTSGMIVDRRKIILPREKTVPIVWQAPVADRLLGSVVTPQDWPLWSSSIAVPAWASKAFVEVDMAGVLYDGTGSTAKTGYPPPVGQTSSVAGLRIRFGTATGPDMLISNDATTLSRSTAMTAAQLDVTAMRGTNQALKLQAWNVSNASGGSNRWWVDTATTLKARVTFSQE